MLECRRFLRTSSSFRSARSVCFTLAKIDVLSRDLHSAEIRSKIAQLFALDSLPWLILKSFHKPKDVLNTLTYPAALSQQDRTIRITV